MIPVRSVDNFVLWLDGFLDYERIKKKDAFSLETMRFLVERFNNPQDSFRSIHVAGSKGKGSVSTMIASIIEAGGMKCGLYTSPHMLDFTERVKTAHDILPEEIYQRAASLEMPRVDSILPQSIPGGMEPSWFELVTLFSFLAFREAGLEWAVIETGLGGRLDATNVVRPEASVITPIELEHTEYLGHTIEAIAGEKAGIIKEDIPVFISLQKNEARTVFLKTATMRKAPVFCMEDFLSRLDYRLSVEGLEITADFSTLPTGPRFSRPLHTTLSLVNTIQAQNAALAAYTVKHLFPDMDESVIETGLSRAWLPGRFEIISKTPLVVLDGAHTVQSITLTVDTFLNLTSPSGKEPLLLFACAADKDVGRMAAVFADRFPDIILTKPGDKKQSDITAVYRSFNEVHLCPPKTNVSVDEDYTRAVRKAFHLAAESGRPLLVTGSFYLVSEAKKCELDVFSCQGN